MSRRSLLLIALLLVPALCLAVTYGKEVQFMLSGLNYGGYPLAGGKIYTYLAGSTASTSLYADAELTSPLDNPCTLDSSGRLVAYGNGAYKFIVKDGSGNTVFTVDDVDLKNTYDFSIDNTDPHGLTLYQRNIISSSTTTQAATIASLTVTNYTNIIGSVTLNIASVTSLIATLGADLGANGHKIVGLATGTSAQDAVSYGQVSSIIQSASVKGSQLFTSGTGNFTVPVGTTRIWVTCVGGGGGGAGSASSTSTPCGGGGGSGGSVYRALITSPAVVVGSATWTITVGAGGAGGTAGANGSSGGASSVVYETTTICFTGGGNGGTTATAGSGAGGSAGSVSLLEGAAISTGSPGATSRHYHVTGNVYAAISGNGGSNVFGTGGDFYSMMYDRASGTAYISGVNGAGFGSGGSGAVAYDMAANGGNGANGFVLLEW